MNPTRRLYYDDPWLVRFEATVVASEPGVLVLDESAFYPESGGQLADLGTLAGLPIVDVAVDDGGVVRHLLDPDAAAELPAVGARITGEVDRARRRLHMALHTGQHILSAALLREARAETVSSRLGATGCTIDLDKSPDEARIAAAEALANAVVDDDVTVRAYFPSEEELASLALRRKAKVERDVRIVAVGDFDYSPCGGTHCSRSAQVGLVAVTGLERHKGGTRVTFAAGARARQELGEHSALLRGMARELSCGVRDVREGLAKLRHELGDVRGELGRTRGELGVRLAEELLRQAAPAEPIVAELPEVALLRPVASRLTAEPGRVALLAAAEEGGVRVFAARGAGSAFDCGAFVKRIAGATGGRGGGRAEHAEGRLPAGVDFGSAASALLADGAG